MDTLFTVLTLFLINCVSSHTLLNVTLDPASEQIYNFKRQHPEPIGVITTSQGSPIEIRDTTTVNSDLLSNIFYLDSALHLDRERIPERLVHAKGLAVFGYFEVTHDVSKYTKADVFNGVGKKTPLIGRFSTADQNLGGSDFTREFRGFAVKMYTKEGNLDLLSLNNPVFTMKDPLLFPTFVHSGKRNPRTNLYDTTTLWDFITLRPESLFSFLWRFSDNGIPNGYRKMDAFTVHSFLLNNKHGDKYYAKINFRTEQGIENLPSDEARRLAGIDPDYFSRDLYNAIENKNYPSWRLELDIMPGDNIKRLNYNPFDLTRRWNESSYRTVPVGRMVFNRNQDNNFRATEQVAFNPINLVPGIPGPQDQVFRGRHLFYRDAGNYRLGVNRDQIEVNCPMYAKTYLRDGHAPVKENMKDAPNYFPNSFNGPVPFVDESRPGERLVVYGTSFSDLQSAADFYNREVVDEKHKQRLAENIATSLATVKGVVLKRALNLLTVVDSDLGHRVSMALPAVREKARRESQPRRVLVPYREY